VLRLTLSPWRKKYTMTFTVICIRESKNVINLSDLLDLEKYGKKEVK
jgi:hypothetical protein